MKGTNVLLPDGPFLDEAPVEFIEEVCGIYFRSVLLKARGHTVPQHEHDHDHATFVGAGAVRVWADGRHVGDYEAGRAIPVRAGVKHAFQALKDHTRLACVHDVASAEAIKSKGV